MKAMSDIISSRNTAALLETRGKEQKPRHLIHEWQAFAYKVWKDYCGLPKELPNMIRFHKQHQSKRNLLNDAYNFCVDYQGKVPRYKLFYWHFWKKYKGLSLKFMG